MILIIFFVVIKSTHEFNNQNDSNQGKHDFSDIFEGDNLDEHQEIEIDGDIFDDEAPPAAYNDENEENINPKGQTIPYYDDTNQKISPTKHDIPIKERENDTGSNNDINDENNMNKNKDLLNEINPHYRNDPQLAWKIKKAQLLKMIKEIEVRRMGEEQDEDDTEIRKEIEQIEVEINKEKFMADYEQQLKQLKIEAKDEREDMLKSLNPKKQEKIETINKPSTMTDDQNTDKSIHQQLKILTNLQKSEDKNDNNHFPNDFEDKEDEEEHFSQFMNNAIDPPTMPDTEYQEISKTNEEYTNITDNQHPRNTSMFVFLVVGVAICIFFLQGKIKRFIRKNFKRKKSDDFPFSV